MRQALRFNQLTLALSTHLLSAFALGNVAIDAENRRATLKLDQRSVNQKVNRRTVGAHVDCFAILDLPFVSQLFELPPGASRILSHLIKAAANEFLPDDAVHFACFVVDIEHPGIDGVKYKYGIVCQLKQVAIFAAAICLSRELSPPSPGKDCKSKGQEDEDSGHLVHLPGIVPR